MYTPMQKLEKIKRQTKPEWKLAFAASLLMGLLVHMPMLLSDIPNHDGLDSMYFDQNMITSGRWFLTIACGFSSYFTLPWLIGLLGIFFLACTAVALTMLLELTDKIVIVLVSGLLVVFPALTATFAYVFTLDGYMLALFLAVLSVLLTKKYKYGFVGGGVCLACSMGTYQAYLSFAMILCIYMILLLLMEKRAWKDKIKNATKYLAMGVWGVSLYFVTLQVLLKIQGKELASYQGINTMGSVAGSGILANIKNIYYDFFAFTAGGNVFFNNFFSGVALLVLAFLLVVTILLLCKQQKWWKNLDFFVIIGLLIVGLPVVTNIILIISPQVTYHMLMRYQWVLYLILTIDFISRYTNQAVKNQSVSKGSKLACMEWGLFFAAAVLIFNYAVTDNIAYSNLQKRYEKTYAYCLRLLDRMEQTEGYYQGIPIAIIGVVGDEQYPLTDITGKVTDNIIGMNGDSLLYTGANYQAFMKHYLGATMNFLKQEQVTDIYYSEEYIALDSFPGPNSTKVVDGILYVKTENVTRE